MSFLYLLYNSLVKRNLKVTIPKSAYRGIGQSRNRYDFSFRFRVFRDILEVGDQIRLVVVDGLNLLQDSTILCCSRRLSRLINRSKLYI